MTIKIIIDDQTVFQDGQNVLMPFNENERDRAFNALTDALAVLAGVTPRGLHASMEGETDARSAKIAQCPDDRTDGVVVHLAARLAARDDN